MGVIVPACAVVTAPVDGRVRHVADVEQAVRRGDVVALLDAPAGRVALRAPIDGRVGGPLASPAQSVGTGEGVVWLSRH